MSNSLLMNFTWATTSPLPALLTLPFRIMSIASMPRKVRHAVRGALECLGAFVVTVYASLSLGAWRLIPQILKVVQYSYRLVTYCDLLLLPTLILLLYASRHFHNEMKNAFNICLAVAVALIAQAVLVKFTHASTIRTSGAIAGTSLSGDRQALLKMPGTFYGHDPYVISADLREHYGICRQSACPFLAADISEMYMVSRWNSPDHL
jgi:hypothetical protein